MSRKISIRIDDIAEEWNELSKYIQGSRSDFVRQCIVDRVRQKDELTELRKDYTKIKSNIEIETMELKELQKRISDLEKQQELNVQNGILVNELLDRARTVAENEELTEQRLIAITQNKIDYRILKKRLHDEGITVYDSKYVDKDFNKSKDGERINSRIVTIKEKSSFETMMSHFYRNYKNDARGKSPLEYLEANRTKYEQMLEKYDDLDFKSFKEKLWELYK